MDKWWSGDNPWGDRMRESWERGQRRASCRNRSPLSRDSGERWRKNTRAVTELCDDILLKSEALGKMPACTIPHALEGGLD